MVRVAINGFGRIGRLVFRAGINDSNIEFVGIRKSHTPVITPAIFVHKLKSEEC